MGRILGLLLLLGVGWLIVRQLLGTTSPKRDRPRRSPPRFEKTVRCARCGVHLPLALARLEGNDYVCTDTDCEHRGDTVTPSPDHKR